ncbi:hypothetical protein ACVWYG_003093 [Pedobacter sp. UYEF25]
MKNVLLLCFAICLCSCSKEKFGPLNLKDGQVVELLVGDKYGSDQDELLILPARNAAEASLYSFTERRPGFTYKVKAKFVVAPKDLQDGPAYYFEFINVISKERYAGNESFTIPLIVSYVPGGPVIQLNKSDDNFFYLSDKIQLTYKDEEVRKQLEEIWQHAQEIRSNWPNNQQLKWRAVKATAKHDSAKFDSAYLVEKIEFQN